MARRAPRGQDQSTEVDPVAVAQTLMLVPALTGCRGQHGCGLVVGEVAGAAEEVGVQVGVGDEPDPQPRTASRGPRRAQVAGRIDHERAAVAQVDHVGAVAQALVDHRRQEAVGFSHRPGTRRPS